jgi:hypothetical protein
MGTVLGHACLQRRYVKKQEVNMLRPLAIAIGLALCLLGPSSAYAAGNTGFLGKFLVKEVSWAWTYLREGWTYKNGKVILKEPIKLGRYYERDEIDTKPAWGVLWGVAVGDAGVTLWNNRQK